MLSILINMADRRENRGEQTPEPDYWHEIDRMVTNPDDELKAAISFQQVRIALHRGDYKLAETLIDKEWLQKGYFEAIFLNGYLRAIDPQSDEDVYIEGLIQALQGCNSYINIQMLQELKEITEAGIARGIIPDPGNAAPGGEKREETEDELLHRVISKIQWIVSFKEDPEYLEDNNLRDLAADLRRLI